MWARYSRETESRLDHDVAIAQKGSSPWAELVDAIVEQRGRIKVEPSDLEGRGAGHPLFRMAFVAAKAAGAVDWFNGIGIGAPYGKSYGLHRHHIFPTGLLYANGYSPENHLHKKIVNEIANFAFLTADSNIGLGKEDPASYLPDVEKRYAGALAKQFVPDDPSLWAVGRFEGFLGARRARIAKAINQRMDQLLTGALQAQALTLRELIASGEGPDLEFKSSFRWDYEKNQVNVELQKVVVKAVAGFLNSEGGTVLIGVADDGKPLGIAKDCATLQRGSGADRQPEDAFLQALETQLINGLGAEFTQYVHATCEETEAKRVGVVKVDRAPRPVGIVDNGKREFYIRAGNTTRALDPAAAIDYAQMHWSG